MPVCTLCGQERTAYALIIQRQTELSTSAIGICLVCWKHIKGALHNCTGEFSQEGIDRAIHDSAINEVVSRVNEPNKPIIRCGMRIEINIVKHV